MIHYPWMGADRKTIDARREVLDDRLSTILAGRVVGSERVIEDEIAEIDRELASYDQDDADHERELREPCP